MSNEKTEILTPAGRLVMGDPFEAQTKDAEGNPLITKTGPNAGQPRVDFYMGLAIAKSDASYNELYATIYNVAKTGFPTLFDANNLCINPKFAFKITDGDSQIPNGKGNKPCDREGFPGHWILHFSGGYAPKCYKRENGALVQIVNKDEIKRGYYIRISGSVASNGSMQQPGIYLNHSMVELVGFGEEIFSGKSADEAFGTTAAALPPGASAVPVASTAPAPGAPAPTPPAPGAPAPTPGSVAPAPDILVVKSYNVNGQVFTETQLTASGWTTEAIAALPAA